MGTHKKKRRGGDGGGAAGGKKKDGASVPTPAAAEKNEKEELERRDNEEEEEDVGERLTLAALDAISSEDDSDDDNGGDEDGIALPDGDEDEGEDKGEWDAEARALRQAIAEGAFDSITGLGRKKSGDEKKSGVDGADDAMEEVALASSSSSDEEEESKSSKQALEAAVANPRALESVVESLASSQSALPWVERFDVVPSTPLPFNNKGGSPADVHDDLKREVAFYNLALEAVGAARVRCSEAGVKFSRPDDFFAEMVKTDDHMAKVKDRLIFETKKMEAFEQRKSNREFKLRAKEARSNKLAEKAKAKKDHMRQVEEWARDAASSRRGGGVVGDDDEDYLGRFGGGNKGGRNRKREAADRKYGHGGKRGRFKQNDRKSLDDMSGYNPVAMKNRDRKGAGGGSGGKNKRKGKRARDAARSKR